MTQTVIRSVRLSFGLHKFEFATAVLVALAFAAWAWSISLRSDTSVLSASCIAQWADKGPAADPPCAQAVQVWGTVVVGESSLLFDILALLPFGLGLVSGVPIVAGELESGTARTAWWLYVDRLGWLARRATPIVVATVVATSVLALGTDAVERARVIWGYSSLDDLGRHGFLLVADTLLSFTIALAVGSLIGRVLPALIVATALTAGLVFLASQLNDLWLRTIPPVVVGEGSGPDAQDVSPGAVVTGWMWRAPDGGLLSRQDGAGLAHAAGVPLPGPGDEADSAALEWLEANGYLPVTLGVPRATALSWAAWEMTGKLIGAAAFAGLAGFTVRRRRP